MLPGTANITATSTNFGTAVGTATTTANLNVVETSVQAVESFGDAITIRLESGAPTLGRLVDVDGSQGGLATATIPPGEFNTPTTVAAGGFAFEPLTEGTTTVEATVAGFVQTSAGVVTVDVTQPGITIPDVTVPAGPQRNWSGFLGAPDHGGVTVTLTSSSRSVFLLSPDANTAGMSSIDISVPNGQTGFSFYVQGFENQGGPLTVGQTIVNATAPGYISTGQATVVVDVNP